MSLYLAKSKNNIKAAEALVNNRIFNPSAHCAYYAALLMVKHLLDKKGIMNYASQDSETKGSGSHNVLISKISPLLQEARKADSSKDYMVWLYKLKMMRKKADYSSEDIQENDIYDNFSNAQNFVNGLIAHFNC